MFNLLHGLKKLRNTSNSHCQYFIIVNRLIDIQLSDFAADRIDKVTNLFT